MVANSIPPVLAAPRAEKVLMLLLLLALATSGLAQDYTYLTNNGTITITHYNGSADAVTIPNTINGLPVTGIADHVFALYWGDPSLTNVTIPDSITSIGTNAFNDCRWLTAITVDTANPAYASLDGVLFDKGLSTLIECPSGKAGSFTVPSTVTYISEGAFGQCSLTNVTIPSSVTSIGDRAFRLSESLTSVTMPESVTKLGALAFDSCTSLARITLPNSLTNLGDRAFQACGNLANVTIGDSLAAIGEGAFYLCENLRSITIPNSVATLGTNAFYQCTALTNVVIGSGVATIGEDAFYQCTSLTRITIPSGVVSIGDGAFQECAHLTAIAVDALNTAYTSADGVLFNKSLTTLIQCPGAKAGSYTIPSSVTNIGDWAFDSCAGLTSVNIPNGMATIGWGAFFACAALTSVTIPDSLTTIGASAFTGCANLTDAVIGHRVATIGDWAFSSCANLTNITIPPSVTSIGDGAFDHCARLSAITVDALNPFYSSGAGVLFDKAQTTLIQYPAAKAGSYAVPGTVVTIGGDAFSQCAGLTSVTIPNGVTAIGGGAFARCTGLVNVTIPDSVTSLGSGAFWNCTSLTDAAIGNGVVSIDNTFFNCNNLTSVTIGNGVTNIGNWAFAYCSSLLGVYFRGNAPTLDEYGAFYWDDDVIGIYYLPGTSGWTATYGGYRTRFWALTNPLILSTPGPGVRTNAFGFTISWATQPSVVVEACTDLAKAVWLAVSTNTLTDGACYFSDPHWTNYPARVYRLRSL